MRHGQADVRHPQVVPNLAPPDDPLFTLVSKHDVTDKLPGRDIFPKNIFSVRNMNL